MPAFFDAVPTFMVVDPLGEVLGAAEGGRCKAKAFADAWQGWARVILVEHAGDPALIAVVN